MPNALQVPTWPDPLDTDSFADVYAVVYGFAIEVSTQIYTIHVKVYVSAAAEAAGKEPIADIIYRNKIGAGETWDGVFPDWTTSLADTNFVVPLVGIRDWALNTIKANDARFAGSSDL